MFNGFLMSFVAIVRKPFSFCNRVNTSSIVNVLPLFSASSFLDVDDFIYSIFFEQQVGVISAVLVKGPEKAVTQILNRRRKTFISGL